jgi:hypothetical protein
VVVFSVVHAFRAIGNYNSPFNEWASLGTANSDVAVSTTLSRPQSKLPDTFSPWAEFVLERPTSATTLSYIGSRHLAVSSLSITQIVSSAGLQTSFPISCMSFSSGRGPQTWSYE